MTKTERDEAKASLLAHIDEWILECQESDAPFDCYIADRTTELMVDAAFAVLEAIENDQVWLKGEGWKEPKYERTETATDAA